MSTSAQRLSIIIGQRMIDQITTDGHLPFELGPNHNEGGRLANLYLCPGAALRTTIH